MEELDKIISKYDKLYLDDLKDAVYQSKVNINGELVTVEDVPLNTYLKTKVSDEKIVDKFNVTKDWLETLDILFDREFSLSLDAACEDAKIHKSYKFDEVFSDV